MMNTDDSSMNQTLEQTLALSAGRDDLLGVLIVDPLIRQCTRHVVGNEAHVCLQVQRRRNETQRAGFTDVVAEAAAGVDLVVSTVPAGGADHLASALRAVPVRVEELGLNAVARVASIRLIYESTGGSLQPVLDHFTFKE